MPKPKKKISHRVLMTELSAAIDYMNNHNFGYARDILVQIYKRLKDYDLEGKRARE